MCNYTGMFQAKQVCRGTIDVLVNNAGVFFESINPDVVPDLEFDDPTGPYICGNDQCAHEFEVEDGRH